MNVRHVSKAEPISAVSYTFLTHLVGLCRRGFRSVAGRAVAVLCTCGWLARPREWRPRARRPERSCARGGAESVMQTCNQQKMDQIRRIAKRGFMVICAEFGYSDETYSLVRRTVRGLPLVLRRYAKERSIVGPKQKTLRSTNLGQSPHGKSNRNQTQILI
jgi:hypothetical protein